jgi:hypothetical protein
VRGFEFFDFMEVVWLGEEGEEEGEGEVADVGYGGPDGGVIDCCAALSEVCKTDEGKKGWYGEERGMGCENVTFFVNWGAGCEGNGRQKEDDEEEALCCTEGCELGEKNDGEGYGLRDISVPSCDIID